LPIDNKKIKYSLENQNSNFNLDNIYYNSSKKNKFKNNRSILNTSFENPNSIISATPRSSDVKSRRFNFEDQNSRKDLSIDNFGRKFAIKLDLISEKDNYYLENNLNKSIYAKEYFLNSNINYEFSNYNLKKELENSGINIDLNSNYSKSDLNFIIKKKNKMIKDFNNINNFHDVIFSKGTRKNLISNKSDNNLSNYDINYNSTEKFNLQKKRNSLSRNKTNKLIDDIDYSDEDDMRIVKKKSKTFISKPSNTLQDFINIENKRDNKKTKESLSYEDFKNGKFKSDKIFEENDYYKFQKFDSENIEKFFLKTSSNNKVNENILENVKILKKINPIKDSIYDSNSDEESEEHSKGKNFIIHPDSKFKVIIDFLVLLVLIYSFIYLPIRLIYNEIPSFSYFVLELIFDSIFIVDLLTSFIIGFYDFEENYIINIYEIIFHYLRSYFFIDLLSGIPFNSLILFHMLTFDKSDKILTDQETFYQKFSNIERMNSWNDHFTYKSSSKGNIYRIFRTLKILKILSRNSFIVFFEKKLKLDYKKQEYRDRLLSFFLYFLLISHISTCIFIFLGSLDQHNWIFSQNLQSSSFADIYLTSLYFNHATIFTIGYGDVLSKNIYERLYNIFLMVVGIMMYSFAITSISNIIQQQDEKTKVYLKNMDYFKELSSNYKIKKNLEDKICRYFKYNKNSNKNDKNDLLKELPLSLRNELIVCMYKNIITSFVFFKNYDNLDFALMAIVSFKPISSLKDEILVIEGEFFEEIIFVKKGVLSLEVKIKLSDNKDIIRNKGKNKNKAVLNDMLKNDEIQSLKILKIRDNEHFGDVLLFLNERSPLSVRTRSKTAELFLMNKNDLLALSDEFPQIFEEIYLKSSFNMDQIKTFIKKSKIRHFQKFNKNIQKEHLYANISGLSSLNNLTDFINCDNFDDLSLDSLKENQDEGWKFNNKINKNIIQKNCINKEIASESNKKSYDENKNKIIIQPKFRTKIILEDSINKIISTNDLIEGKKENIITFDAKKDIKHSSTIFNGVDKSKNYGNPLIIIDDKAKNEKQNFKDDVLTKTTPITIITTNEKQNMIKEIEIEIEKKSSDNKLYNIIEDIDKIKIQNGILNKIDPSEDGTAFKLSSKKIPNIKSFYLKNSILNFNNFENFKNTAIEKKDQINMLNIFRRKSILENNARKDRLSKEILSTENKSNLKKSTKYFHTNKDLPIILARNVFDGLNKTGCNNEISKKNEINENPVKYAFKIDTKNNVKNKSKSKFDSSFNKNESNSILKKFKTKNNNISLSSDNSILEFKTESEEKFPLQNNFLIHNSNKIKFMKNHLIESPEQFTISTDYSSGSKSKEKIQLNTVHEFDLSSFQIIKEEKFTIKRQRVIKKIFKNKKKFENDEIKKDSLNFGKILEKKLENCFNRTISLRKNCFDKEKKKMNSLIILKSNPKSFNFSEKIGANLNNQKNNNLIETRFIHKLNNIKFLENNKLFSEENKRNENFLMKIIKKNKQKGEYDSYEVSQKFSRKTDFTNRKELSNNFSSPSKLSNILTSENSKFIKKSPKKQKITKQQSMFNIKTPKVGSIEGDFNLNSEIKSNNKKNPFEKKYLEHEKTNFFEIKNFIEEEKDIFKNNYAANYEDKENKVDSSISNKIFTASKQKHILLKNDDENLIDQRNSNDSGVIFTRILTNINTYKKKSKIQNYKDNLNSLDKIYEMIKQF